MHWHSPIETGYLLRPGLGGCRYRKSHEKIDLIVLHWTGGEQDARGVYRTLRERQLGAHFCVQADGIVYQFAALTPVATYHCGKQNGRSIGVEIVNQGISGFSSRPIEIEEIHGKFCEIRSFWPAQIDAVVSLVKQLCFEFAIPLRVALDSTLIPSDFSGICGHFQLSRRRLDPGLELLRSVEKGLRT